VKRAHAAILALAAAIAAPAALAATPAGELFDRSQDRILQRAAITSRGRTHGEVRLVERGSVRVVQTLLYSKLLRRVLSEIGERERENWPADREGHEASARYLAALERAEREIPPAADRGPDAERRRSLLIEFAVSKTGDGVALLAPQLKELDGALVIESTRLIEVLELPREFIQRNMGLIAEEHFALQPDELARLLAPPGPAEGENAQAEEADGG
jgi:hypothetical protein